ncbi:MAG: hypothetical protein AAGH15_08790 [Myxococcota bacterium]
MTAPLGFPQCAAAFDAPPVAGPFRWHGAPGLRCRECALIVIERADVARLQEALDASHVLPRTALPCPRCAAPMGKWLVSRGDRMLELEPCLACGLVLLDEDELGAAAALLADALPGLA